VKEVARVTKNHDEIVTKILSKIGKPVTFTYPGDELDACGILKDRYVLPAQGERSDVPYWDVVDLIEFPKEAEREWIRIGYYRMPKDRLVWGSQTTITEPIAVWRSLLTNAAKGKPWFRKLLEDVLREVKGAEAEPASFHPSLTTQTADG
jgi:hypothetical protein